MAAQIIRPGMRVNYTAIADVNLGDIIFQGDLAAVAVQDIAAGEVGKIAHAGLFGVVKGRDLGTAITAGTPVYWNAASEEATANDGAGANKLLGVCMKDCSDTDHFVRVLVGVQSGAAGAGV